MKLEDQVSSLELSRRLKELGVKQESHFYWINDRLDGGFFLADFNTTDRAFSAFTVAELGVILPVKYNTVRSGEKWWNGIDDADCSLPIVGDNEAEARSRMVIYCLENNFITVEEVNARITA